MKNIEIKSIGTLLGELCTETVRCWMAQEKLMTAKDVADQAQAGIEAQQANARRVALIQAIDHLLDKDSYSLPGKTYE